MLKKKFMIYMVGISGSGKTTIATALSEKLIQEYGVKHQFIDGDIIRSKFGDVFGYTYEERMKCNRAVRVVAGYLLDNDIPVILAQVGGYQAMRDAVRETFAETYVEIYVKCSLETCAKRDVKGYYNNPKKKLTENFNGSSAPFEEPVRSNLVIDTEKMNLDESVNTILYYLESEGYIGKEKKGVVSENHGEWRDFSEL